MNLEAGEITGIQRLRRRGVGLTSNAVCPVSSASTSSLHFTHSISNLDPTCLLFEFLPSRPVSF